MNPCNAKIIELNDDNTYTGSQCVKCQLQLKNDNTYSQSVSRVSYT